MTSIESLSRIHVTFLYDKGTMGLRWMHIELNWVCTSAGKMQSLADASLKLFMAHSAIAIVLETRNCLPRDHSEHTVGAHE